MREDPKSYASALRFVGKTFLLVVGVSAIAYVTGPFSTSVDVAHGVSPRAAMPAGAAAAAAAALPSEPTSYYPAQFPAPSGDIEPAIPTF
jgi:hypothetical protein